MESLRTCKLFGVIRAVLGIKGALPLIHGPIGCYYHIKYLLSLRSSRTIRILSTEMDQNDVVFGGEDKLLQKIYEADEKYSPQLIAVLSSCASSIIGENINKVIDDVENNVNAELITISSGGFEGSQIEGYLECLTVLVDLMEPPPKEDNVRENSVNLIGQYRGGPDLKILKEYFDKLGIKLTCVLTSGCTLEEVKLAPIAYLNISMCEASGIEPCELMEKKFGIPFLHETLPIGVKATGNYLQEICKKLDRDYVFAEDEKRAEKELKKYLPYLRGKKAVIVAGATRAVALTRFLSELGMEPVLICLDFEGKYTDSKMNEIIKERKIHPIILKQPDYTEILCEVENLKPDIIFGGMGEIGLSIELGIPLIDVMHGQEVTFGFEGSIRLARKIKDILEVKSG
ncbi:MAG: nitrogenase component 1 [Methanobacteriaceae archaeon]|jgi:light-independent protochlorophyllide reductase B subunit|nr:nitrogenase component 1 [Methanobacteriaceae archaeon]